MPLAMTFSSCSKNPMEVETLSTGQQSLTVTPMYGYITIHNARLYNIHDIGIYWPSFWRRKYRVNLDFTYSFYIHQKLPHGTYFNARYTYLYGYDTKFEVIKLITDPWGYIHIECHYCRKSTIAYTCKIDNPIRMQLRFEFFNAAGRLLYDVWSNIYYIPIILKEKEEDNNHLPVQFK